MAVNRSAGIYETASKQGVQCEKNFLKVGTSVFLLLRKRAGLRHTAQRETGDRSEEDADRRTRCRL
jgi:hypothetical protein